MHFQLLVPILAASAVSATLNQPCIGSGGRAGVCVTTATCSSSSGTTIDGACPWDGAGIKCCTKASCSNGSSGNCRWGSDCAGSVVANQCPGPAAMKCCSSTATGFGGYSAPSVPAIGGCKAAAVNGAKKVIAAFPGRVREIGCTRSCTCGASGASDHCCGKAIDFMCSDGGGVPTMSGKEIAEWVMNNRSALGLKYVIWGQKIWSPGNTVTSWTNWKIMENRNSITENHWDHVHVSFN